MTDQLELHKLGLEAWEMSVFTFSSLVIEWDTISLLLEEVELLTQNIYDVSKLHILEKSLVGFDRSHSVTYMIMSRSDCNSNLVISQKYSESF